MGRPKQLLPLGDRCLVQIVLDEALASCLDEVVVILGHRAQEVRQAIRLAPGTRARVVVNADFAAGQSGSLRFGLRASDRRAVGAAVLLGDQPRVTSAVIDAVAAAFLTADPPVARATYTAAGGDPVPGHPVLLARRTWPEVEKLRGDRGARDLLAARPDWVLEVPVQGPPPGDVDTWEEYQQAVAAVQCLETKP